MSNTVPQYLKYPSHMSPHSESGTPVLYSKHESMRSVNLPLLHVEVCFDLQTMHTITIYPGSRKSKLW